MKINEEYLKAQVEEFCIKYINENDLVIGILRYGAHIPHIYQNVCKEKNIPPKQINLLLSHMISFFPKEYYANKNIILLDDTIYTGHELTRLKDELVNNFEIPEANIHTAALVVHEDSPIVPELPKNKLILKNAEYIAWKEVLGALVAQNIRPTERDHPLYFFESNRIQSGHFLDILQEYGQIHSVGNGKSSVLKISLTIDSANLVNEIKIPGVDLGSVYKVRFYWEKNFDGAKYTAVPMGFPVIALDEFVNSKGSRVLAQMVGLRETFFEDIHNSCPQEFCQLNLFYFASRCIYAYLLESLIKQITQKLAKLDYDIRLINPEEVDTPVNYIFPNTYKEFYSTMFNRIHAATLAREDQQVEQPPNTWKKLTDSFVPLQLDSLLPSPYKILGFLASDKNIAKWNGKEWFPNYEALEVGKSFQEILSEFQDSMFVSKSLDYLLESGLLRAKDMPVTGKNNCYTRSFLPGGEYNAMRVSRVANVLNFRSSFKFDPAIAEEEAVELWGPY